MSKEINKKVYVDFGNIVCPRCGNRIYVKNIYKTIRNEYQQKNGNWINNYDPKATQIELIANCECGTNIKITFDCNYDIILGLTASVRKVEEME